MSFRFENWVNNSSGVRGLSRTYWATLVFRRCQGEAMLVPSEQGTIRQVEVRLASYKGAFKNLLEAQTWSEWPSAHSSPLCKNIECIAEYTILCFLSKQKLSLPYLPVAVATHYSVWDALALMGKLFGFDFSLDDNLFSLILVVIFWAGRLFQIPLGLFDRFFSQAVLQLFLKSVNGLFVALQSLSSV